MAQRRTTADGRWRWDGRRWQPTAGVGDRLRAQSWRVIPGPLHRLLRAALYNPFLLSVASRRYRDVHACLDALRCETQLQVATGPFKGLHYVRDAGGSEYPPKLLGTYEKELWPVIEEVVRRSYDTIIDVGAAEGYYLAGLGKRLPRAQLVGFEVADRARALLTELLVRNGMGARADVRGLCTVSGLNASIPATGRTFLLCDVDGGEGHLMDPVAVPALRQIDVLLELHDHACPGISSEISRRFAATHQITLLTCNPRTEEDWPHGVNIESRFRASLLSEWRPGPQNWFWMTASVSPAEVWRPTARSQSRETISGGGRRSLRVDQGYRG